MKTMPILLQSVTKAAGLCVCWLLFSSPDVFAQWRYDWTSRSDQQGKPAGVFETTPFPVSEASTSYSIVNDEGTKTFSLGAIYFVDNSVGLVNGTTTYDPVARSNTGGTYTCYTSVVNALAAHSSTSGQNKTFLIREGTYVTAGYYSLTNHWGVDDTHRFSLIGYKQERPILDGAGASGAMFGGGNEADIQFQSFFTLQRVKVTNRVGEGVYIGRDTVGVKRCQYTYLIDVWFYRCAYSADAFKGTQTGNGTTTMTDSGSPNWAANQWVGYSLMNVTAQAANRGTAFYAQITTNSDRTITTGTSLNWQNGDTYYVAKQVNGSVYYLNADHGWIYHCTLEQTMGHGIKIGDGTASMTLEWSVIRDNGFWAGLPFPYHLSRTVGIDFPNDTGKDEMSNNVVRYNIMSGCGSHGMQVRGVLGISIHHNEITNWGGMWSTVGYIGGVTSAGLFVQTTNPTSGAFFSNFIHHPAAGDVTGFMINDSRNGLDFLYYNNVIHALNNGQSGVATYTAGGTSRFLNNTIYGATSAILLSLSRSTDSARNNIIYQTGSGRAALFGATTVHTNNLYCAPGGSVGVVLAGGEFIGDPRFASLTDFSLQPNSPCIGAATPLRDLFLLDLGGATRGSAWDIGALEYSGAPINARVRIQVSP